MSRNPNILFILADDLGWADLSVYGQTSYETPHLDRLAAQGVRFTQAYANSAVCSATRFALITGRYQYRLRGGLEEPIAGRAHELGLPPDHPTLPSLLKAAGYDTALIGKWHLGNPPKFAPQASGYDRFFGNLGGVVDYFTHKPGVGEHVPRDLWEGNVPVERTGYYTQVLADEASGWIRGRADAERPFLLSLHFTAPHWPWEGPGDEQVSRELRDLFHYDGGGLAKYAEIVQALDAGVGQVLQALDDAGLLMNGVSIPHYCWHPKLTIDGSCRLCQVEIQGQPKLQIACNTPVADGMVVHTESERVRRAREGVMELLLVNHPLDCPICDQAGECKLQDYAFEYGMTESRTREPRRALKKNVDLGPTIVFDQERCILCTRCVRS